MKYEILEKEARGRILNIKNSMEAEKNRLEKIQKQMQAFQEMYRNQFVNVAGIGCITFIFEALLHHQSKEAVKNYCEMKGWTRDATEFMELQKERMNIIQLAQKQGLVIDFEPEKDIEDFLKGANKFKPGTIEEFLKNIDHEKVGKIYSDFTQKTTDFFNRKKEEIFKTAKKEGKHEFNN